jgi:pimeloyl-ACP methyl ester carboxylesterase
LALSDRCDTSALTEPFEGEVPLGNDHLARGRQTTTEHCMNAAVLNPNTVIRLDPREAHHRIESPNPGLSLFLRHLPPPNAVAADHRAVLYLHGGTFPSALSVAHRFDGRSWRDALNEAGFHVWGLDFQGFGLSDPYLDMTQPAEGSAPLGRADDASRQAEAAVRFIASNHGLARISIVAHSWGTMVAGRLAGRCPELIDRLVFFGPITWRPRKAEAPKLPGWRLISLKDQWDRFTEAVPQDAEPVLSRRHFDDWGERYLDTTARAGRAHPRR